MNRDSVEEHVRQIVREDVLLGSDRELPGDVSLADLGLDSLALVTFLTRVEAAFDVTLPDEIWVAREPLTLGDVAELVADGARAVEPLSLPDEHARASQDGRMVRIQRSLQALGLVGRVLWPAALALARVKVFAISRSSDILLERRLQDDELPDLPPPSGVVLRPYQPSDDARLAGLWPAFEEARARRRLADALRSGALALVAVEAERVVALDLLSAVGEDDVRVIEGRGVCYGYRLVEAPAARGRGIGVALLSYSLVVARDRGFRAQVTSVQNGNRAMLVAATHLLGFRQIGSAHRVRVLGRTRWSWEVDGGRGAGPQLLL
jgi:acyl carrier protein